MNLHQSTTLVTSLRDDTLHEYLLLPVTSSFFGGGVHDSCISQAENTFLLQ